jgi:pyruvate formate lyase activating enzyme
MPKPKRPILGNEVMPKKIVDAAKSMQCESIAYTYTEPTIYFEYAYETAKLAYKEGIRNIFVTNGYITEEALRVIAPYIDAANIDLKSYCDSFYRKVCGARLKPVLDSIKLYRELGIWVELTTLIVPSLNDSEEDLRKIAEFIKDLDDEIPWHVSRFFPVYKLSDLPPTPQETLEKARKIGLDIGLKHIYLGNIPGKEENTYCHSCGRLLVGRRDYQMTERNLKDSKCSHCDVKIKGIWR